MNGSKHIRRAPSILQVIKGQIQVPEWLLGPDHVHTPQMPSWAPHRIKYTELPYRLAPSGTQNDLPHSPFTPHSPYSEELKSYAPTTHSRGTTHVLISPVRTQGYKTSLRIQTSCKVNEQTLPPIRGRGWGLIKSAQLPLLRPINLQPSLPHSFPTGNRRYLP